MLMRRLVWSLIYGFFAALAALAARFAASRVYRIATGEDPPKK